MAAVSAHELPRRGRGDVAAVSAHEPSPRRRRDPFFDFRTAQDPPDPEDVEGHQSIDALAYSRSVVDAGAAASTSSVRRGGRATAARGVAVARAAATVARGAAATTARGADASTTRGVAEAGADSSNVRRGGEASDGASSAEHSTRSL